MTKLKLSILTVLTLIITSSLFYSCSNQDDDISPNLGTNLELLRNLKNFNNNYIYEFNSKDYQAKMDDDRGFWGWVGTVAATVSGDVIGAATTVAASAELIAASSIVATPAAGTAVAITAGVVGAVGGSYVAYQAASSKNSTMKTSIRIKRGHLINLDLPSKYNDLSSVGLLHNQMLDESYFGKKRKKEWIAENMKSVKSKNMELLLVQKLKIG